MGQYTAESLERKLAWMRERQQRKQRPAAVPSRPAPLPAGQQQMLRVKQVSKILGVSAGTVRQWFLRRAVIVKSPHKSVMLIPQRALDEWIREHTSG